MRTQITIEFDNEQQAYLMALFLKRLTFDDIERRAVDKNETYAMRTAIEQLQGQLALAGFSPR